MTSRSRTILVVSAMLVVAIPTIASAQRFFEITPPAGWQRSDDLSKQIATTATRDPFFGNYEVESDAFLAKGEGVLYVSIFKSKQATDAPEVSARTFLDQIRSQVSAAELEPGTTELLSWKEQVRDNAAEGVLVWRHRANGTRTWTRVLFTVGADGIIRAVGADCVTPEGNKSLEDKCHNSLTSLAVRADSPPAAPLGELPPVEVKPDPVGASEPTETAGEGGSDHPTPTIGLAAPEAAGSKILYVGDPPKKDSNGRWFIIVGGVALVIGLYLSTRQRQSGPADDGAEGDSESDDSAEGDGESDGGAEGDGESDGGAEGDGESDGGAEGDDDKRSS